MDCVPANDDSVQVPGFFSSLLFSYGKDTKLEWRNPAGILSVLILALVSGVIYFYAFSSAGVRTPAVGRGIALALLFFVSYITPARNRAREREGSADTLVSMSPADMSGYFVGKALAVWTAQLFATVFFVPGFHLIFEGRVGTPLEMTQEALCMAATATSLSSLGTLLSCASDKNRLKESLLPLLLLPASVPVFIFASDSMNHLESLPDTRWAALWILGIIYGGVGSVLYPKISR
ncbi:MAG: heme exporter protein CcmB [Spirochaetia bacterium]|nr:heme exporter protein CcmB [Spirochaetia bacterium]